MGTDSDTSSEIAEDLKSKPWKAVLINFLISFTENLKHIIYVIGIILVAPYLRDAITAHAGKETTGNYDVSIATNIKFENLENWVLYSFGFLLLIIIILCFSLYRMYKTNEKQSKRLGELQPLLMDTVDDQRGSSGLSQTGRTNPTDL